ncbi:MAG TPA: Xaa-Pro peptidase family protein [Thermoleophilaceae bacterium]|nr:Xaa-Pro peptidase family protein [Thermoleophilaceae bacterium]
MSTRADRLTEVMERRELDSLLVSDLVNVRWLTGFTGTNGAAVVTRDRRMFLTDFRYTEQAEEQVDPAFERLPAGRDLVGDLAEHLTGRAGFDDAHLSVRTHGKLAEKAPDGAELVPAGGAIEELREVKDAGELERVAAAQELASAALERVLERGLTGRTERAVALELEQEMRVAGATGPSFASIVASGPHGALPHAVPRDVEIPAGQLVVVDWGALLDGYCSDCTRTVATGPLEDEAAEAYELVRRAQQTGLEAVRAGASCKAVDAAARDVITEAGFGDQFGHSLGHGVGLEVHEGPTLSMRAEGDLKAGNVVSVEPGVYLPGRFGIRIEDLVAVTETGADVFTRLSKDLLTVG